MLTRTKPAIRAAAIRYGMDALHFSRAPALIGPFVAGVGAIAMLHRVQPDGGRDFRPNQSLEITPQFLEQVVGRLRRSKIDLVSLDEMRRRLTGRDFRRRFVCLTFDDGYRDNKRWAYPILKSLNIPFAIYVATSFPHRLGMLYWVALESIIARNDSVVLGIDGERSLPTRTLGEKRAAYRTVDRRLRSCSSEPEARAIVQDLANRYGVDLPAVCDEFCLTWPEIRELAADPLVTIGAHTVNHVLLPRNLDEIVRSELAGARVELEAALGRDVRHLAYPFGAAGPREFELAAEAGYATAVTTRPSVLFQSDRETLMSLPRIAIDGAFQRKRYVDVLASGAGTAVWNGFGRIRRATRARPGNASSKTRLNRSDRRQFPPG